MTRQKFLVDKITMPKPPKPLEKIIPLFTAPKGMPDILPEDQDYWREIQEVVKEEAQNFNFKKIDTPILEDIGLFQRGTGEATDIVEKEMFELVTKGGQKLALRPEFTPGIIRAYLENGLYTQPLPIKLYSFGPIFRYAQPQAGRFRQFHQFDFEIIGDEAPILDAQLISLVWQILKKLKLKGLNIQINTIGCQECRPDYEKLLRDYYHRNLSKLCSDCRRRLRKNPLRLLDCKEDKCRLLANNAPQIVDHLCGECHDHFKSVLEFLDELALPYILNPSLARGLDYYTKTVFEIWPEQEIERQSSLGGGGRYDLLVKLLGGRPTPAVGFAGGVERIISLMKTQKLEVAKQSVPKVYLAQLGELAKKESLKLFEELRGAKIAVAENLSKNSLKSQLKLANKLGVKISLILGQKEALEKTIIIRDMSTGVQEVTDIKKVIGEVKKRLKR